MNGTPQEQLPRSGASSKKPGEFHRVFLFETQIESFLINCIRFIANLKYVHFQCCLSIQGLVIFY